MNMPDALRPVTSHSISTRLANSAAIERFDGLTSDTDYDVDSMRHVSTRTVRQHCIQDCGPVLCQVCNMPTTTTTTTTTT